MEEQVLRGGLEVHPYHFGGKASKGIFGQLPVGGFGEYEGMVERVDDVFLHGLFQYAEVKHHTVGGGSLLLQGGAFDGDI